VDLPAALIAALCLLFAAGAVRGADPARPGPHDRCPVCGMMVAPFPDWLTIIVFKDGSQAFFDGPKDMFRFYFDIPKFRKDATAADVAAIHVTDYYTTKLVLAQDAFFILGSDVRGPMGHELVPVKGKKKAESFRKDHHGTRILSLKEVTRDMVAEIE
jgi:nitrous oxide reductase accessory protein NosL